ncbi:MAG: hypothetical protein HKL80_06510 [Acidimicrobiales bacterium]|nr:hypothetical protein [Acidimicrobiales bacterium]
MRKPLVISAWVGGGALLVGSYLGPLSPNNSSSLTSSSQTPKVPTQINVPDVPSTTAPPSSHTSTTHQVDLPGNSSPTTTQASTSAQGTPKSSLVLVSPTATPVKVGDDSGSSESESSSTSTSGTEGSTSTQESTGSTSGTTQTTQSSSDTTTSSQDTASGSSQTSSPDGGSNSTDG